MSVANHPGLTTWKTHGEKGSSSKAIVEYLVHNRHPQGFNDPADPSDFRRCELLLRAVPTLRPLLPRMAELGPRWDYLIKNWDTITTLLDEEVPDWEHPQTRGRAPRAYAILRGTK